MFRGQMAGSRIGATMRAVRLHAPGGVEQLVCEQVPTPRPRAGETLVRVLAAGITRDELAWPADRLPAIPSYELSGVIVALAPDVDNAGVGNAVFARMDFDRDGAAAEDAVVNAELLAPRPCTLSDIETAAVPLPALSARQGLFDHGKLVSASVC